MLAIQLKNYLGGVKDDVNILVYVNKTNETRQLLFSDLDKDRDGNICIDAEYEYLAKKTTITKE